MKATIKRPNGTTISVDGATAEDIEKLAGGTTNAPHVCAPCMLPHYPLTFTPVPPAYPFVWPGVGVPYVGDGPFPWGTTCMGGTLKATDGLIHNMAGTASLLPVAHPRPASNPVFSIIATA